MPRKRTVSFGVSLILVAAAIACSSDSGSPANPSPLPASSSTTIAGTAQVAGSTTQGALTSVAEPKVGLCHVTGNGSYDLIEVDASAESAHIAHGDGFPSEVVPGEFPLGFDAACGIQRPGVDIEKATNGADADTEPGPEILVGLSVEWTYVVTNTGDFELTNVVVVDDQIGEIPVGSCTATSLLPGDSMTCTASGIAVVGQYANIGMVTTDFTTALGSASVSDSDPSHYLGIISTVGNGKVQLCHRTGNGRYVPIEVGAAAEPAHLAHGDVYPPCPVL